MRRSLVLLLTVLLLVSLAVPSRAAETTNLILLLEWEGTPLPGAVFEIYLAGREGPDGKTELTGAFAGYPVDPVGTGEDTSAAASALYAFAKQDGLTPDRTAVTNAHGTAAALALPAGVYLVAGQPLRLGDHVYHTEPQLLVMPRKDPASGEILKNPILHPKLSREPYTAEPVSRKVLKIWDDHSGYFRPASVSVHLLKNGSVYSTVTLTAQNQWRHTWENLEADALWQIAEDVPKGYSVTVEQDGTTFLLTNSAPEGTPPETTAPPAGSTIPQTGTLWWPIALAAGFGILFLVMGFLLKKNVLKLLGILLLIAAALMTGNEMRKQKTAEEISRVIFTQLEAPSDDAEPVSQTIPLQPEIPDWQRNPHMEMPEVSIDGTAYIGTLEIPALALELPVAGITTGENLQKAPCRYSGSPYTGDLVLGAHNYEAHFGRLKNLSYGDAVSMTDLDNNIFSYEVADIEILQPEQLEDLLSGDWPLTLYTCTPGGLSRVVIRCEQVMY